MGAAAALSSGQASGERRNNAASVLTHGSEVRKAAVNRWARTAGGVNNRIRLSYRDHPANTLRT